MEIPGAGAVGTKATRRRQLWPLCAIFLALIVMPSRWIKAYALEGVHWPAGVVTFQLALGSPRRTLLDGNTTWNAAAAPALTAWNNVIRNLQLASIPLAGATPVSGDGVNSIVFATTMFGDSFGSHTLAVTYYIYEGSTISEADVLLNNHQTFDSYRGPLRYGSGGSSIGDIRRVLIHELGHAIGLDHPDDHGQHVDAIMNSVTSDRETPSADDIAGAQAMYGAPSTRTREVAIKADFNGDQHTDYLLFNAGTRQTAIWHLSGNTFTSGAFGPTLPEGWAVTCSADVNLDGKSDYILFNAGTRQTAVWYINGSAYAGGAMGPAIPIGWTLIAAADMNGDGHPDYVLFNLTTGQTAIWFLKGTALASASWGPTIPGGWTLIDISDFNADGKPDLILVNAATRQTVIWYMNGTAVSSGSLAPTPPAGWVLQGTADFDYDGKPDYVLFNPGTRQTAFWYLNGVRLSSYELGPPVPAGYSLICR